MYRSSRRISPLPWPRLAIGARSPWKKIAVLIALAVPGFTVLPAASDASSQFANWPAYLFNVQHSSYHSSAKAITPSNASTLVQAWRLKVGVLSSPTVYRGVIYIGAQNGNFYALNEATGTVIWQDTIGTITATTCGPRGFASTATVATDPSTKKLTVYVASATGYMYAFDAASGTVVWRSLIATPSTTQNDYYDWSSPAVANGKVYVGISSQCDTPLVRGGLDSFDQVTGASVATFYSVPAGDVGGSIWSSPAVDSSGAVWVTTGNGPTGNELLGDSESIIKLNGTTLVEKGHWQLPNPLGPDSDFGASPTLFSATLPGHSTVTRMVGACNKNGYYYVFNRANPAAGPIWAKQVGAGAVNGSNDECIEAANFDGIHLWITGPTATIGGASYPGSVQEVDPATGTTIWQTGVGGGTDGSAALDGGGVISVATFDAKSGLPPSADYLLDASTGTLLATLNSDAGPEFSQPVFADQYLLLGTVNSVTAYALPANG
jgi:outer membrane protein assembly factor BamB